MRILFTSLLLLASLNPIFGRSFYWNSYGSNSNHLWNDYNYDYDDLDIIKKSMINEKSEESKDNLKPELLEDDNHNEEDQLAEAFSSILSTFLDNDAVEEKSIDDTIYKEKIDNIEKADKDDDDDYGAERNNPFLVLFPFSHVSDDTTKSSEEINNSDEVAEKRQNSKETSLFSKEADDDDSSEMAASTITAMIDLTKSSEENKEDEEDNISKKDIEELVSLIVKLSSMDELTQISNKSPEYTDDDELKAREVDEYLYLFSSILENILENELETKEKNDDNKDYTPTTTTKNSSEEKDESSDDEITTYKNDSNEEANGNTIKTYSMEDDDKTDTDDSNNTSNSNENEIISLKFHGIGNDRDENLNDHRYEIIETPHEFEPTSSPYTPNIPSSSSYNSNNDRNIIEEYVELRKNLDSEQDTLQSNKANLDKDFYTILSSNYNEDSINKFEKDIFVAHDNLDRIKRNINAIQNLSSKLYFHKIIKTYINDAQKEEELF